MAQSERPLAASAQPTPANHRASAAAGSPLDQLSAALAGMLSPSEERPPESAVSEPAGPTSELTLPGEAPQSDGPCEITPLTILEALLFVGSPNNEPLSAQQLSAVMRGVQTPEIDEYVRELNSKYAARNCPYEIVTVGAGYRLVLRDEYRRVRDKFYGKLRQARLSQAAIEVLAAVAYNEPLTRDEVNRLRGTPCGPILTQLVRRELLRLDRADKSKGGSRYYTTPRFLELFGLDSLDDLPRSQDLDRA